MAEEAEGKVAGGGGKGAFAIALVLLAVIGAGAGAGFSMMFFSAGATPHEAVSDKQHLQIVQGATNHKDAKAGGSHGAAAEASKDQIANLDPILVTLAGPQRSWARLELGIILEG